MGRQKEAARVEALPVQHPHAAGVDIGSRSHWICVGFTSEADTSWIREFPAHTAGLKAIVAFLREHQVTTIAMESTGIYWIPRIARDGGGSSRDSGVEALVPRGFGCRCSD